MVVSHPFFLQTMSHSPRSAIVTLAMGAAVENLDYTFSSFAKCSGAELHAFILDGQLPQRRLPGIEYHLLKPSPDFSHTLREIYYRRLEVLDDLGVRYALTVDSLDVLCLHPLPAFEQLLGNAHVAACVEHLGCRYLIGQGYTSSFLNGGVFLWDVPNSRDIRREIAARGRERFRTIADDQFNLNEVIQTRHYDRLRILPCQYNYRAFLKDTYTKKRPGWPVVEHLDGVMIYHNASCIDGVKKLPPLKPRAELPALVADGRPLSEKEQFWRRLGSYYNYSGVEFFSSALIK
jgi:hypothetical protein